MISETGQHVVVADLDAARAEAVATGLRSEGLSAESASCDAADRVATEALCETLGPVDALINLAGVARNDLLVRITDADFDLTIATHLKACLNTMRAFLPQMRKRGYGRVVNMSSTAARGTFGGASYAAAKGGIEALTRTAAFEMAQSGVTANCVAAGLVNAGMFLTVPQNYQDESISRIPMRRAAQPEEIGACIRFLASPEASYVTGQTLFACGGLTIGPI
jgi:3-oxoacyl-[acyl-carrier protein] reductase